MQSVTLGRRRGLAVQGDRTDSRTMCRWLGCGVTSMAQGQRTVAQGAARWRNCDGVAYGEPLSVMVERSWQTPLVWRSQIDGAGSRRRAGVLSMSSTLPGPHSRNMCTARVRGAIGRCLGLGCAKAQRITLQPTALRQPSSSQPPCRLGRLPRKQLVARVQISSSPVHLITCYCLGWRPGVGAPVKPVHKCRLVMCPCACTPLRQFQNHPCP